MNDYWRGKRAIVVGGSAGLGRALAEVLVSHGARVAIVGRGVDALNTEAERLRGLGGDILAITADVTRQDDVARMYEEIIATWEGVDLVAHCAGRSTRGDVLATAPEAFRELWEVNFLSAVRVCQACAPSLVDSRGHIVLIGSLASKFAPRYLGGYPASKFAVAALAQQLRLELEETDVHVLLVCPGPIVRDDIASRYSAQATGLPAGAQLPGGGAKVASIDPMSLSERILRACERRDRELMVPAKARLLAILAQISPRFGDWLLKKAMSR